MSCYLQSACFCSRMVQGVSGLPLALPSNTARMLPSCRLSEERPLKGFEEMGDEQRSLRLPSLGQSVQKPKAPVLRTTIIIAIW